MQIQEDRFILEILFLYEWCQNGVFDQFLPKIFSCATGFFSIEKHIFFNSL